VIDPTAYVHSSAIVTESTVGPGASVHQFASLVRGARIGRNTSIAPNALIDGSAIGDNCRVGYGVNMGPGFLIGDGVFLGPMVVLCNDNWPRAHKVDFDMSAFKRGKRAVVIGDGASLGCRATVLAGVRIGRGAMIAAHSVVTRDVPDNHLWLNGETQPILYERQRMRFVRELVEA
jgi:UDP-2-acetamido-3-amino-2,3-dideoxy-glucuronate N-acetyltransferase